MEILKWIAEGNRGLVYMRIMRAASEVLYDPGIGFEFGRGYILENPDDPHAWIVSSGRGVHEALSASEILRKKGIRAGVADMPSIDGDLIAELHGSGKPVVVAEQNNGYIWPAFRENLFKKQEEIRTANLFAVNTLDAKGRPQFIHSGTYEELLRKFGLDPVSLAGKVESIIKQQVRI